MQDSVIKSWRMTRELGTNLKLVKLIFFFEVLLIIAIWYSLSQTFKFQSNLEREGK